MGPLGPVVPSPSTIARRRVEPPPAPGLVLAARLSFDASAMNSPTEDPAPAESADAPQSIADKAELLRRFVAASGRERREVFKALKPHLDPDDLEAIAFALRDPSPKLSSRITALLARHGRRDLFEAQLDGLKPGKIAILRGHFDKIAGA